MRSNKNEIRIIAAAKNGEFRVSFCVRGPALQNLFVPEELVTMPFADDVFVFKSELTRGIGLQIPDMNPPCTGRPSGEFLLRRQHTILVQF